MHRPHPWTMAALAVLLVGGCMRGRIGIRGAPVVDAPPAAPDPAQPPKTAASILSAHFAIDDAPPLGKKDALPVVFSTEIDATSLIPQAFVVTRLDGTRVLPERAILAPADEMDENRTVLLIGDFGDPTKNPPSDVTVIGTLHAEDGRSLRHLAAKVDDYATAGTIVFAHTVEPDTTDCGDAAQVVRTYWIDGLRGVEEADLSRVEVEVEGGAKVSPVAFDDHGLAVDGTEAGQDNVLDLCLTVPGAARRVRVAAGAFADPVGHPSAAVDVPVG